MTYYNSHRFLTFYTVYRKKVCHFVTQVGYIYIHTSIACEDFFFYYHRPQALSKTFKDRLGRDKEPYTYLLDTLQRLVNYDHKILLYISIPK